MKNIAYILILLSLISASTITLTAILTDYPGKVKFEVSNERIELLLDGNSE